MISHVDDLLFGGNDRGRELLLQLGKELAYGSLEEKEFVYCGKLFKQHPDGAISVSMRGVSREPQTYRDPLGKGGRSLKQLFFRPRRNN